MTPQQAFALAIRIAGLVSLLYFCATAPFLVGVGAPVILYIRAAVWLVLTIWLLRGAPALVRFSYPGRDE